MIKFKKGDLVERLDTQVDIQEYKKVMKYDDKEICPDCGSHDQLIKPISTDGGHLSECETMCLDCGEGNYWAYGFYNRKPQSLSSAKRGLFIFYTTIIILVALLAATTVNAAEFEATFYLKTKHVENGYRDKGVEYDFNESHDFIGIEYRSDNIGYAVATFENSYRRTSVMVDAAYYMPINNNFEFAVRAGVVTGYDDYDFCIINGAEYCPMLSASIAYTEYDIFVPKLIILPTALAVSFSTRF